MDIRKKLRRKRRIKKATRQEKLSWTSKYIIGTAMFLSLMLPRNTPSPLEIRLDQIMNDPNLTFIQYNHKEDNTPKNRKILAQALCGEGRSEFTNDYFMGSVASMINRGNKEGVVNAVLRANKKNTHQYSTFNKFDVNYPKITNPLEKLEGNKAQRKEIWSKCNNLAKKILRGEPIKIKKELANATNYYVSKGDPKIHKRWDQARKYKIPGWAFEKKKDGITFRLDKNRNRIPIEPIKIAKTRLGDNAYIYAFKNY
ncbi:MAG TPA: hypothetical protein ENG87_00055 [Candidatus Pacearchaeota archaeon]|nr:hypothetical protein BMS3Abin17_00935 [archaeon BMS3Abin17]HDK41743.1 hypothetical protein [Candidatus Pacearchaeota archaeon]HDZ60500.1 hypothetical protein [Candidatus Pacearchaeota archaeon]